MKSKNYVKSIYRAVSILKYFTPEQLELSGTEVGKKAGIHKTSAHRILLTLSEDRILDRNEKTGKYKIGPELYRLGNLYLDTTDIPTAAELVITTLNDLTGEAVAVGILNMGNVTLVLRKESKYDVRYVIHLGTSPPAYSSSIGKALLSQLDETKIDGLYPSEKLSPVTRKTITTKRELKQELEHIRKTGISIDVEGCHEGVTGIASVIRNAGGEAIAGMSIALPSFRLDEAKYERLVALIRMGCSLVSYSLGYKDQANPIYTIQEIRSRWEENQLDSDS